MQNLRIQFSLFNRMYSDLGTEPNIGISMLMTHMTMQKRMDVSVMWNYLLSNLNVVIFIDAFL